MGFLDDECVKAAFHKLKEIYGEDFKFEEGDEFCFALNNCTLILANEDSTFKIKYIGERPIPLDVSSQFYKE